MSLNPIRPWRNIERRKSRQIMVGNVPVGGDAPISVQTMTNADGHDVRATLDQVIRAAEAVEKMSEWHSEGRLQYRVDVYDGLETAPRNINRLFDGSHSGKLIIKVGEEP